MFFLLLLEGEKEKGSGEKLTKKRLGFFLVYFLFLFFIFTGGGWGRDILFLPYAKPPLTTLRTASKARVFQATCKAELPASNEASSRLSLKGDLATCSWLLKIASGR